MSRIIGGQFGVVGGTLGQAGGDILSGLKTVEFEWVVGFAPPIYLATTYFQLQTISGQTPPGMGITVDATDPVSTIVFDKDGPNIEEYEMEDGWYVLIYTDPASTSRIQFTSATMMSVTIDFSVIVQEPVIGSYTYRV